MIINPGFSYRFHHMLWSGLDLLFPPACGGCGKLGIRWCEECQQKLTPIPPPLCEVCGRPESKAGTCKECLTTRPAYHALRSCVVYTEPARPALISLKYRQNIGLGEALAWHVASHLDGLGWQADLIVPVPLSKQRFFERGYNQVDLIAHPIARLAGWQYQPTALHRTRHTGTQVGLNSGERRRNVQGAFQANTRLVAGKTILLVDDVTTTGATLGSASQALMEAGAGRVYALTFAMAIPKYGLDHVGSQASRLSA